MSFIIIVGRTRRAGGRGCREVLIFKFLLSQAILSILSKMDKGNFLRKRKEARRHRLKRKDGGLL